MRIPNCFDSGTVAIFGGSFDPITFTHVQVAAEVINFELADQVWVVPCGMRPDKQTNILPEQRLEMVSLAIESMIPDDFPIFVDPTEVAGGRYYPTRELMCIYRERYPNLKFKVLLGNDLLTTLHLWDDFSQLVSENLFIVYRRIVDGQRVIEPDHDGYVILDDAIRTSILVEQIRGDGMGPTLSNISSTEIRKRLVRRGVSGIVGLTPLPVIHYILKNGLYNTPPQSPIRYLNS
jgi:nicotinate (nicotinamide) nucleotide adenylyltransferase